MGVIKKNFKKIIVIVFYVIVVIFAAIYFSDDRPKDIALSVDATKNEQSNILGSKTDIKQKLLSVVKNEYYPVIKVVDGDTIDIDMSGAIERLRLIGVNTPETVDTRRPVECFGTEASQKAKELLVGQKVKIVDDDTQGDRDRYGRLLRYVFLEDGAFFNLWMIQNGYAHEYTYAVPYSYQADFKQAEVYAKENNLGLWDATVCDYADESIKQIGVDELENIKIQSDHVFYTSSYHSAKLYYCETDTAWENLSSRYLEEFDNENDLLARYPNKTLHEPCK